jgi:hypothetical protein
MSMFDSHPLAPNLFVIGASKAGTSALHAYLNLHPEIRMSGQKEPCFFVDRADLLQRWAVMAHNTVSHDVDTYLAAFDGGEGMRYRGESSTLYAMHPSISGVAGRIATACPDARIIYCVREPVTRTISHYWQENRYLNEKRSLEVALREDPIYRYTSDYALQMEEYLAHFGQDRIHVVVSERLRRDRLTTLAEIFDWLGVASFIPDPEDLADMHVTPPVGRQERIPGIAALRDTALWQRLRKSLPDWMLEGLGRVGTRPVQRAQIDDEAVRAELAVWFAERTTRFEELIGRRIPEWHE